MTSQPSSSNAIPSGGSSKRKQKFDIVPSDSKQRSETLNEQKKPANTVYDITILSPAPAKKRFIAPTFKPNDFKEYEDPDPEFQKWVKEYTKRVEGIRMLNKPPCQLQGNFSVSLTPNTTNEDPGQSQLLQQENTIDEERNKEEKMNCDKRIPLQDKTKDSCLQDGSAKIKTKNDIIISREKLTGIKILSPKPHSQKMAMASSMLSENFEDSEFHNEMKDYVKLQEVEKSLDQDEQMPLQIKIKEECIEGEEGRKPINGITILSMPSSSRKNVTVSSIQTIDNTNSEPQIGNLEQDIKESEDDNVETPEKSVEECLQDEITKLTMDKAILTNQKEELEAKLKELKRELALWKKTESQDKYNALRKEKNLENKKQFKYQTLSRSSQYRINRNIWDNMEEKFGAESAKEIFEAIYQKYVQKQPAT